MIRDITIGQYYNADSVIHRMDPRTKIIWAILYMIMLFIIDGPIMYGVILAFTFVMVYSSHVPFKFILRGLKPIMIIVVITALLNLFTTQGETVLFTLGKLSITLEGLELSIKMALRIVLLIMGTSLLTLTTSPTVLSGGLEVLLSPLKKIGVPVSVFVMMISIALRFISTLLEETDKIIKAQTSRGADFENGNIIKRVKAMIPILIPLFVNSFRRADELATAMECRCYNCDEERTSYRRYRFTINDLYALIALVVLCAVLIVIKVVQ